VGSGIPDATHVTSPRPRRASTAASAALLTVAVSLGGFTGLQAATAVSTPTTLSTAGTAAPSLARHGAEQDAYEAEVLRLTNEARSQSRRCGGKRYKKTRSLRWSPVLAASADAHSADMATRDYFSHYAPGNVSPFERMRAAGYRYRAAGENIAAGRSLADPAAVVRAWLNSPGHCKVLMNPRYRELGVGRVEGAGKWGVYWTQNFGQPR
jgi:uncharacterized protein YkwD